MDKYILALPARVVLQNGVKRNVITALQRENHSLFSRNQIAFLDRVCHNAGLLKLV
jgi:hypothetical protein